MSSQILSDDLHQETRLLRRRLEDYLAQAHRNEAKLRRFQSHELRLIGLNSMFEVIQEILYPDPSVFSWDMVHLLLLNPKYEIRRILDEEGVDASEHAGLMFTTTNNKNNKQNPNSLFPTLGPYKVKQHGPLFAAILRSPNSVALLPLVRHG